MTGYDEDVVAWAQEQAALLRSGRISEIDLANIAEEIEDVGKSEKRDLAKGCLPDFYCHQFRVPV